MDRNAGEALAGDVAAFEIEPTLSDIDAIPVPATRLPQCQISDAGNVRLKRDGVFSVCLDHHLARFAVANDLDRLIDDDAFPVNPGTDQYAITWVGRLQGIG